MDYIKPNEVIQSIAIAAEKKANLPVLHILWLWNQIPVTVGNLISGIIFTAICLHVITKEKSNPI
ncbi:hypothetical protein [Paucisalibacillus sp. EB02]|uniref:hypothetical protein n=1 Tax=Paucisalibacillus sp. EB02 TaxID=1347087 RepID=UPI0004BBEBCD|nr:hypothetical protein [Paucisalibacillus sp. EB02]